MSKKVLCLVLALSMVFSMLCIPVSAGENTELKLSTVSFTENKSTGAIAEGAAKTTFAAGDKFALKLVFSNAATKTYVKNFDLAVAYQSDVLDSYSFEDEQENTRGPAMFMANWTAAGNAVNSVAKFSAANDNGMVVQANAENVIAYFLFQVKADAESGTAAFAMSGSENAISGTETKEATNSTPYTIDFTKSAASITINGAAPTIESVALDNASVTVNGTAGATVKASAQSTKKADITGNVTWSISAAANDGVSIAADGTITVGARAKAGSYTVTAAAKTNQSQGENKTATLTVTRETAKAAAIQVKKNNANLTGTTDTVIIPAGDQANEYTYSAVVTDQFGDTMENSGVSLTMTGDLGPKFSNNKLTLAKDDIGLKDKTGTLTVSCAPATPVTITVTAKDIEITKPTVTSKPNPTFGDKWSDIIKVSGGSASLAGANVPGTFTVKDAATAPAIGTQTWTVVFNSTDGKYTNIVADIGSVKITKPISHKNIEVTGIDANGYEYTGSAITPDITVKDGDTTLVKDTDYTLAYSANTAVGTAAITITGAGNYTGTKTVNFQITKTRPVKDTHYTVTLPESGAYTGKAFEAKVTKTDANVGNITVKYNGSTTKPTIAGTYAVTVDIALSNNFAAMTAVDCGSFTISKAPLTLTAATVADKTYNDNANDAKITNVTFGGLVNGESLTKDTDYTATGVYADKNAGDSVSVTVTVTLKDTARAKNYALSAATVASTGKVSKTTTTLSLKAKDAAYTGAAYDTANITKTSNVETAPTYTYYADNKGTKGDALQSAPKAVGTYWVTGYIAGTDNNSDVTSDPVKFSITKATLTITAKDHSITYGDAPANNGATYDGFVDGDDGSVVTGLEYGYNYEQFGNAGSYVITPKGATAANYNITLKPGKLTVEKKAVTLSWSGHTGLYYDGKVKAVTAEIASGLVNNDAVTVAVAGGAQKEVGSYTAKAIALTGTKAGNYKLPESGLTQAYEITYALTNVTATPATVMAVIDQSKLTVKLVGYYGAEETVALTDYATAVTDKKLTANGVEYTVVDQTIKNESSATLGEDKATVTRHEDAEEGASDAIVAEISAEDTKSTNLIHAVAEAVIAAAKKDTDITAAKVSLSIKTKAFTTTSLKLEIKPVVIYTRNEAGEPEVIPNSAIKAPVTVSVKLPATLEVSKGLVARHGKEYLKVTVENGIATWQQSSFSEVELIPNSTATVNFTFADGSSQTVIYTAADINKPLPVDSKSGFRGWLFGESTTPEKTLTKDLLEALAKLEQPVTATLPAPSGGGSSGGSGSTGGSAASEPVERQPARIAPFWDVAGSDYFFDAVVWAVENKITDGVGNGFFAPNDSCTRAQAVTFLWRAAGKPAPTGTANPFKDVNATDYYYDAVLWAIENKITDGVSATEFAPNATVSRAQMMTFMWRAAGKPTASTKAAFNDVAAGDYFAEAVAWAAEQGITKGVGENNFGAAGNCPRAQIVTFLWRNLKK